MTHVHPSPPPSSSSSSHVVSSSIDPLSVELDELSDDSDSQQQQQRQKRKHQATTNIPIVNPALSQSTSSSPPTSSSVSGAVAPTCHPNSASQPTLKTTAVPASLPSALRGATLSISSLTPHMFLFPSHKWDSEYASPSIPIEQRRTSFESLTARQRAEIGCPVLMNTPDALHNARAEDDALLGMISIIGQRQPPNDDYMDEEKGQTRSRRAAKETAATSGGSGRSGNGSAQSNSKPHAGKPSNAPTALRSTPNSSALLSVDDESSPSRSGYIKCVKCKKWRCVPLHDEVHLKRDTWHCEQNTWDDYSRCNVPDEVFEEGELWPGMPKRFVRLMPHYIFYKSLIRNILKGLEKMAPGSTGMDQAERFPFLRRKPIDLGLLYECVTTLGGYDKVSASNQWQTVQSKLGFSDNVDSTAALKKIYKRLLHDYEKEKYVNPRTGKVQNHKANRGSEVAFTGLSPVAASSATAAAMSVVGPAPSSKKRPFKVYQNINDNGGVSDDENEDGNQKKKQQKRADTMDFLNYQEDSGMMEDQNDGSDNDADGSYGGKLNLPSASMNQFQSMIAKSFNKALNNSITSMRNAFELKLNKLEKKLDDRMNRIESTLLKAVKDSTAELKSLQHVAHIKQKNQFHIFARDTSKQQELLARGMNMLIAERIKSNLPKIQNVKVKGVANTSAAAGATGTATPVAAAAVSSSAPQAALLKKRSGVSPHRGPVPAPSDTPTANTNNSPTVARTFAPFRVTTFVPRLPSQSSTPSQPFTSSTLKPETSAASTVGDVPAASMFLPPPPTTSQTSAVSNSVVEPHDVSQSGMPALTPLITTTAVPCDRNSLDTMEIDEIAKPTSTV